MSLLSQALADGAAIAYIFNETSGNLINQQGNAAYDLSVDASVTRSATGVVVPDLKAMTVSSAASGSTPTWGHIQGTIPSVNGCKTFSLEIVAQCNNTSAKYLVGIPGNNIGQDGVVIKTVAGVNLQATVVITGLLTASGVLETGANAAASLRHYVLTWDGQTLLGYSNAVQAFTVNAGAGNVGILNNVAVLSVGGFPNINSVNMGCTGDFLAMYTSHILTPTEITAHYNAMSAAAYVERFAPRGVCRGVYR